MDQARAVLLALAGMLLVLSVLLVLPFLQFFLLAVLLAFLLRPLQRRLENHTRSGVAALLLVAGAAIAAILPLLYVVWRTAAEASALLAAIREGEITTDELEGWIEELVGIEVEIGEMLRAAAEDVGAGAFDGILGLFGTVTHLVIGVGLTLFLLYYFLRDGDVFVSWTRRTVPGSNDALDRLFGEISDLTWAVLAGHVLVAIVQGVIAGVGLVVVGIPDAVLWTVVMIVLAVLPVIGSFLVWGPASLYLLAAGRPVAGLGLFVYGTVIVGLSDDYLRPILVDRYARLSPAVIIVGILGGIYLLGFMGIFFGPIIVGALRATLDIYREEYVENSGARDPRDAKAGDAEAGDTKTGDAEVGDTKTGDAEPGTSEIEEGRSGDGASDDGTPAGDGST